VIGSSDETKSRWKVDWTEGKADFIPANGGKALGWLHTNVDATSSGQPIGHAIIYNIKIPLSDEKIHAVGAGDDGHVDEKVGQRNFYRCSSSAIEPNASTGNKGEMQRTGQQSVDAISLSELKCPQNIRQPLPRSLTTLES
jgi:hypothetical protein